MGAIEVSGLTMAYGEVRAVDDVSFEVADGEFFGIIGPNGAGKTTTLELIEGLRRPDSGDVLLLGERPWPRNPGLLPRIGVQLQASSFFERLTAREQIHTFASLYDVPRTVGDEWLERVGLVDKADTRVEDLSGGQHKRLSIACALVHDPEVVFLDEPTAALDPQARRNLWDLLSGLNDSGRTVVLTTHYMDEAEVLCDRVAILDHGRLLQLDSPAGPRPRSPDGRPGSPCPATPPAWTAYPMSSTSSRPATAWRSPLRSPGAVLDALAGLGAPARHLGDRRHPRGRLPRGHRAGVPRVSSFVSLSTAILRASCGTRPRSSSR